MQPTKRCRMASSSCRDAVTGRVATTSPSASPVLVVAPSRSTATYVLSASSNSCANLVASPKQMGKSPVARGSSVPVWPAFWARYRRFAPCSAALDDRPRGLSRSRTPSIRRLLRADDVAAIMSGRVLMVFGNCVVDQLRQAQTRLDRIVVGEVQLRHAVQLEPVRELAAQISRGMLQRRDYRGRLLRAAEMRHEDLRVRKIRRDFDRRHRDHADARVLDVQPETIGELTLDLVTDALRALGVFLHRLSSPIVVPTKGADPATFHARHCMAVPRNFALRARFPAFAGITPTGCVRLRRFRKLRAGRPFRRR